MKKLILLLASIFIVSMLLAGCIQPVFDDAAWDSSTHGESFFGSEDNEFSENDDWTDEDPEAWPEQGDGDWASDTLQPSEDDEAEFIQSFEEDDYIEPPEDAQDGEFPAEHDPECTCQFHGPHFCGYYAYSGGAEVDSYWGTVEVDIIVHYHCFISVVISDLAGEAVAVLTTMEEMPGDPAYDTVLPGEVPPGIPFDPETQTADWYDHGPPEQEFTYEWDGINQQTDEPVLHDTELFVNLFIYTSPDSAIDLATATDQSAFHYYRFADMETPPPE